MTVGKTARFVELPFESKLVLFEAAGLLMVAWLVTRLMPYAWWTRLLGPAGGEQQAITSQSGTPVSERVNWAVRTAARQFPWQVVCLPQAIAGRWMLARRHVDSTLCIGVRSADTTMGQGAEMHAWLAIDDWVTGEGAAGNGYRIIARFGARHNTV